MAAGGKQGFARRAQARFHGRPQGADAGGRGRRRPCRLGPGRGGLRQGLRLGTLLTIDGAAHEILQERDLYREQFLAAFDAFIPGTDDGAV